MKKLNEIPEKNPFKVPENYFEEVNRKILSAAAGYYHEERKIGLFKKIRPYLAVAAAIMGFILLSYAVMKLVTPARSDNKLSELIIDENTGNYLNDIDLHSLEEDAASLGISDEGPDVSKKEIIDYLILENIEISDIYEQF